MHLPVRANRLRAVARHEDPIPLALETGADGLGDGLLVVDDEDGLLAHDSHRRRGVLRVSGPGVEKLWRATGAAGC